MRIFLLPVSTRRSLIYCERVKHQVTPGEKLPIGERIISRANRTWTQWENGDKAWQKKLTDYGNRLFRRIPYEEWGLKSLPPATRKKLEDVDSGRLTFRCLYPGLVLDKTRASEILKTLAIERQAFHRKRMWNCIIGMPFTIPFALVPVLPNIPFFYLAFRAYSHFRALYGGRMLEHITTKGLLTIEDSTKVDESYTAGLLHPRSKSSSPDWNPPAAGETEKARQKIQSLTQNGADEGMLLQKWNGAHIAQTFELPEMQVEIERAVEQVEGALAKAKEQADAQSRSITASNSSPSSIQDKNTKQQ